MTSMKISDMISEIEKKIADPTTKTRRYRNATFYEVMKFPKKCKKAVHAVPGSVGVIRTIIGYNVRMRESPDYISILVAPGMQKKTMMVPAAA